MNNLGGFVLFGFS